MHARTALLGGGAALTFLIATPAYAQTPFFTESFDAMGTCSTSCTSSCNFLNGWANVGTVNWTLDANGTTSSNTGPSGDHTTGGGNYVYFETSGSCSGGDVAELASPVFTFTGVSNPVLGFWYHMFGSSMGTLHVDVIRDPNGAATRTNDVIPPLTDNRDLWQQIACVPLDPSAPAQVIFRGVSGSSFTSDMAFDDVTISDLPGTDVELADVQIAGGCAGDAAPIDVTLRNIGGAVASVPITVNVNGVEVISETLNPNFLACDTTPQTFRLSSPIAVAAGANNVVVSIAVPGDSEPANDTITTVLNGQPTVAAFPYTEGFEGTTAWASGGTNSSWAVGAPSGAVINSAFSGANAAATNPAGSYNSDEASYLEGPCWDFTGLTNPRFEARIWWDSELDFDGAQLQISTDGGASWITIGNSFEPNWYTSGAVAALQQEFGNGFGFSGQAANAGSGGWVRVGRDLENNTAGAGSVRLRIVFASDGSVESDGFAIDDIEIKDNLPRVEVTDASTPPAPVAVVPGTAGVLVQALDLTAVLGQNAVSGLTFTATGDLPPSDLTALAVWEDDGDGIYEPSQDISLGMSTFTGNQATVAFSAPVQIGADRTRAVFATVDVGPAAAQNRTFGLEVTGAGDVAGPMLVELPDGPVRSPLQFTYAQATTFPLYDRFDDATTALYRTGFGQGSHPTAMAEGPNVAIAQPAFAAGRVAVSSGETILSSRGVSVDIAPTSTPAMGMLDFPSGPAVAALDYHYDLSTLDPATDDVFFEAQMNQVDQTDDPADHILLSPDGGATWIASIHDFDFTSPVPPGWNLVTGNVSAAFRAAGLTTFGTDVVVRIQAAGGGAQRAMFVDDVWAGIPARVVAERQAGTPIVAGGTDPIGSLQGGAPITVTYDVFNRGQRTLQVGSPVLALNLQGISGVGISNRLPATLDPGQSGQVDVTFTPTGGPFGFDLSIPASDPRLDTGRFVITGSGVGLVEPEVEFRRGDGTPVASGVTLDAGSVPSESRITERFAIASLGTGALSLTGDPAVAIENATNVDAEVTRQPPTFIEPGRVVPFEVSLSPADRGAFSFDIVVNSDDADEGTFRATITGLGTAPEIEVSRAGNDIASGDVEDLGTLNVGETQTLTYTLENPGDADLVLTGFPRVRIENQQNLETEVTEITQNVIEAGSSLSFDVTVGPRREGPFSVRLAIGSNDPNESPYIIGLEGEGFVPTPEIVVTDEGGNDLASGATDDVGTAEPGTELTRTYTIENTGTADLMLTADVAVDAKENVVASVTEQPAQTIAPGESDTFTVTFSSVNDGAYGFRITIISDDADEAFFRVDVSGQAQLLVPEVALETEDGRALVQGGAVTVPEVQAGEAVTTSLVIMNNGTGPLEVTDVTISDEVNATVEISMQPDATVPAGGMTVVGVSLTPEAAGGFGAAVAVTTNDADAQTFRVRVNGTASAQPIATDDDGGCTCAQPSERTGAGALAGLGFLLLLGLRRRR